MTAFRTAIDTGSTSGIGRGLTTVQVMRHILPTRRLVPTAAGAVA